MDTNLVNALLQAMADKPAGGGGGGQTTLLIVTVIMASVTQIGLQFVNYLQAKTAATNSAAAKENAVAAKEFASKQAESLEAVHKAVNNERSVMQTKLEQEHLETVRLSKELAAMMEQERLRVSTLVTVPAQTVPIPTAGLTKQDLIDAVKTAMQMKANGH